MTKRVVILQPQYFPWAGVFEQIRLADVYVHYDDVQFPQGRSFTSRVQVKTDAGQSWMTVPVQKHSGARINETLIDDTQKWRSKHMGMLRQHYARAPFFADMMEIAESVIMSPASDIASLNIAAIEAVSAYFGFKTVFHRSSLTGVGGASSQRLVDLCRHFDANVYITGAGAMNYVDYDLFENAHLRLEYMDYKKVPYPQFYGDFIPYVSILDLIAHCGRAGVEKLSSSSVYWRDFIDAQG